MHPGNWLKSKAAEDKLVRTKRTRVKRNRDQNQRRWFLYSQLVQWLHQLCIQEKKRKHTKIPLYFFCILMCLVTLKSTTLALEGLNILMVKTKRELWMMTLICWSRGVLIHKGVSFLTKSAISLELDVDYGICLSDYYLITDYIHVENVAYICRYAGFQDLIRHSWLIAGSSAALKASWQDLLCHASANWISKICVPFIRARRVVEAAPGFPSQNHPTGKMVHCPGRRVERGQQHQAGRFPSTRGGTDESATHPYSNIRVQRLKNSFLEKPASLALRLEFPILWSDLLFKSLYPFQVLQIQHPPIDNNN